METFKDALTWFEIPVLDFARAKNFYQAIFGYEMPEMEMGPVKMGILLHDRDTGVGGAICYGEGYEPAGSKGPKAYLNGGKDLNTVLDRIPAAGGTVVLPKTEIAPDMGYFAFFTDTEGNVLGLHSMG
ncbi:MAG TPA: VOC family protein [Saprospiraceae bacterium]|nr:VOC family protein [Saprospiraceae bacterium]